MTQIVYATQNPGKIQEVTAFFAQEGFSVKIPSDLGASGFDVPENGATFEENAYAKRVAYVDAIRRLPIVRDEKVVIIADDSGIGIDALGGAPGVHTRRWRDGRTRMTDEEIIAYCLEQLSGYAGEERSAEFQCVAYATILSDGGDVELSRQFTGSVRGIIREVPLEKRIEGFPFTSLFEHLAAEPEPLSHRLRALAGTLPWIRKNI